MNNLVDKYRPRRLAQIIGQDKVIRWIRAVIGRRGFDGGALWIEGPTGTGKTSIAQAIAANQGLCEKFARLAHRIADREGLNGQPAEAYIGLVKRNHNSMRAVLQSIQKGTMLER